MFYIFHILVDWYYYFVLLDFLAFAYFIFYIMIRSVSWYTVYKEIFAPVLFSLLSPLLSAGEFKTVRILMFQIISFWRYWVWAKSRQDESVEGRKLNGAKITLYTVPWFHHDKGIIMNFDNVYLNVHSKFLMQWLFLASYEINRSIMSSQLILNTKDPMDSVRYITYIYITVICLSVLASLRVMYDDWLCM